MTLDRVSNESEEILLDSGDQAPPVPVERIARRLGADLRYEPSRSALAGMLFQACRPVIIGINSLQTRARQCFIVAHELGHLRLHNVGILHVDRGFPIYNDSDKASPMVDERERAANCFAKEILIPYFMLQNENFESEMDYEDGEWIARLAKKYEVSMHLMFRRLSDLDYISKS